MRFGVVVIWCTRITFQTSRPSVSFFHFNWLHAFSFGATGNVSTYGPVKVDESRQSYGVKDKDIQLYVWVCECVCVCFIVIKETEDNWLIVILV